MRFPRATPTSAFLAGVSLIAFEVMLHLLAPNASAHGQLFPLEIFYFPASAIVFVVGIKSYTDSPYTEFHLSRYRDHPKAMRFMGGLIMRMFLYFLGAAGGAMLVSIYQTHFK